MKNLPITNIGIVAVSRDNFDPKLSTAALDLVVHACSQRGVQVKRCSVLVETENDSLRAVDELLAMECNALVVVLGNFGPEGPSSLLAKFFPGPVMYCGVEEDHSARLYDGRRDSYCGLLNCSYNLGLRGCHNAYFPEYPIGSADDIAKMISRFDIIARGYLGVKGLKIISFGPRPNVFMACNAPIQPLYKLGVEVEENSELDLLLSYEAHAGDPRISSILQEMKEELHPVKYEDTLVRMAQYEITLLDWAAEHKGSSRYVAFANKCWPAFQKAFGFLPCYVHGRLNAKGIPVACETDIYGALTQFIGQCLSGEPTLLLDINNSLPEDYYQDHIKNQYPYRKEEVFIAYHCGNAPCQCMQTHELKYKLDRKKPYAPETGSELCRGTLEGRIKSSDTTIFRVQASAAGDLCAYVAQGEILPLDTLAYGCYGLFAISQMDRFYRHVLIEKQFPHHCGATLSQIGAHFFSLLQLLGITDINFCHNEGFFYPSENPFLS